MLPQTSPPMNFPVLLHLLYSSPEQSSHCQPHALVHSTLNLLFQPHGADDCPESVWKPPSANTGGRAGSFTEEKQVKGRECCQDEESRRDRAGMKSKRPCTPEEKGSGTCNSCTVAVTAENQNPQDHARCSWSCSSHTMTCTRWKQHQNVRQARMSLYTTSSSNFRKFQTDLFQLILSEGQKDWLKEFKKPTNPKFTWSTFPLQWTTYIPLS